MAFAEWKDNLVVGIPDVDRDHRMLLESVNDLYEAMIAGTGRDVLGPMLDAIIMRAKEHFEREEVIWESGNYSDLQQHREQHADLLKTANEFKAKYDAGYIAISADIMSAMREWVRNHILVSDKEAAEAIIASRQTCAIRLPTRVRT